MTNVKVRGGTPDSSTDLCRTCINSLRMAGEKGVISMCDALEHPFRVFGKIHECTRYRKRTTEPSIYTMYEECWYQVRLKDGRLTFATKNGEKILAKMGYLFNEQEENIRQLTELYKLPEEDEEDDRREASVVQIMR